ncbi:hypothetical protein [Methyloceanibacter sp. wino2]|uniref:hypothetical protein n=1 Tax=Methyloceanibacter sp. wino2 TaxID=2170729 RepID=UPI00131F282A|nr:hypothetical protein [Methyloceanibacter sp. wino2]
MGELFGSEDMAATKRRKAAVKKNVQSQIGKSGNCHACKKICGQKTSHENARDNA